MAGPLVAAGATEFDRFLIAARRRLWSEAFVGAVVPGLWGSAALLAATGMWTTLVAPVPFATAAAGAALPLIAAFGRILISGPPGSAEAAAEADRRLAAGDLLSTAFELAKTPESRRPGAADIVLAQAAARARANRRLPGPASRRPLAPRLLLPLAIVCVGAGAHLVPLAPSPALPSGQTTDATPSAIRNVVKDVREASRRTGAENPAHGPRQRGTAVSKDGSIQTSARTADGRKPESGRSTLDTNSAARARSAPTADTATGPGEMPVGRGARDVAGRGRPNTSATAKITSAPVMPTRTVEVLRPNVATGTGTGVGTFGEGKSPDAKVPVGGGPAASAVSLPIEGAAWTPVLRAYAADYLAEVRRRR